MEVMEFLTIVVMVFALVMLLAGIFTAYFGSGKSRMIGVVLLVVGLIVGILWALLTWDPYFNVIQVNLLNVVWQAFLYIIAALIGLLIAVGIFLLAIMKA